MHAAYLGMVFHLVSLAEAVRLSGQFILTSVHNAESVLAFLIMVVFMIVYVAYKTTSPGIVVFPVVFLVDPRRSRLASSPFCKCRPVCAKAG